MRTARGTRACFSIGGFITWSVPLKSGELRLIDVAHVIRLPDDWQVAGVR